MRYQGGKSWLAKRIVDCLPLHEYEVILEPFCGGGAVTTEIARRLTKGQRLIASDIHAPLISMWLAVMRGWLPPEREDCLSDSEYSKAKSLRDEDPLKAFIGFGCSWGGKYYRGLARGNSQNHYQKSLRKLRGQAHGLLASSGRVTFVRRSFFDLTPAAGMLIYCDPPYRDTEPYPGQFRFDCEGFWSRCAEHAKAGSSVYVSEFSAPGFATEVLRTERPKMSDKGRSNRCTDKLFRVQVTK